MGVANKILRKALGGSLDAAGNVVRNVANAVRGPLEKARAKIQKVHTAVPASPEDASDTATIAEMADRNLGLYLQLSQNPPAKGESVKTTVDRASAVLRAFVEADPKTKNDTPSTSLMGNLSQGLSTGETNKESPIGQLLNVFFSEKYTIQIGPDRQNPSTVDLLSIVGQHKFNESGKVPKIPGFLIKTLVAPQIKRLQKTYKANASNLTDDLERMGEKIEEIHVPSDDKEALALKAFLKEALRVAASITKEISSAENINEIIATTRTELTKFSEVIREEIETIPNLPPGIKNILSLTRSAIDQIIIPELEKLSKSRINLNELIKALSELDVRHLLHKLETDDSATGRLARELLDQVANIVEIARPELKTAASKTGVKAITQKVIDQIQKAMNTSKFFAPAPA